MMRDTFKQILKIFQYIQFMFPLEDIPDINENEKFEHKLRFLDEMATFLSLMKIK